MARKKVELQFIENDAARKVSYRKRVNGLVKKTRELNILTGVDTCAIVYGTCDPSIVVWPSPRPDATRVLLNHLSKSITNESQRLDHESYLRQCIGKSEEQLATLRRKNRDLAMENVMCELAAGKPIEQVPFCDIKDLMWVIDDKLRKVQHKIRETESPDNSPSSAANNAALNLDGSSGNEITERI